MRLCRRDGDQVLADLPIAAQPDPPTLTAEQDARARRVSRALASASRRLPWESTCLAQALAAARMLHRRGVPAQLRVGVKQDTPGQLEAHAWVRAGESIVCGGRQTLPQVISVHALPPRS